ncbi:MAG: electron transfer flavoprotein [Thermoleophilia bacterium]|nr:electron transfer flavoprotein [Thermoleophilia bacterium]
MSTIPADFPPRHRPSDYVVAPTAGEDEFIEVGVLFVGAGPAGLAGAIRLGQLMAEDEALMEALGEVPIAIIEKGKGPGSHLLSGSVMRPGPFRSLFPDAAPGETPGIFGEVHKESLYLLRKGGKIPIPPPPDLNNHGNWVISISQLSRFMAENAEEYGAYMLPETDAQRLLVEDGRVVGIKTGDKGRGRDGEELSTFEPGVEVRAKVTVICEGTQGHLAGVLRSHFDLDTDSTQIYELGVKEVWEVPTPLDRVIHTIGWPLKLGSKWHEYGGAWLYPMGGNMVSIGMVVGLDSADANISAHDLLQQAKTHPLFRRVLEGGRRVAWGAKTIPSGGIYGLPSRFHVPGAVLCGDAAGFVNLAALKGVSYAMKSGIIAAEQVAAAITAGTAESTTGLWGYTTAIKESEVWTDLWRVRNFRPSFQKGFIYGGIVGGLSMLTRGRLPRSVTITADRNEAVIIGPDRGYPKPDGEYIFDKLSSVFLSGNKTRDDQPNHIRVRTNVPRELAVAWENMCPAKVYEVVPDSEANGFVDVRVNNPNCVQCGAITAKGGHLTPPEGGSGPEYTLT